MTGSHYECPEHGRKKKMKRMKCLAYIAAFAVFQTAVILAFVMIVMKIKSPKVRFGTIMVENYSSGSSGGAPAFTLVAQLTVKNTNFGHFKYENSTVEVLYGGVKVGEAFIAKGRARAKQTKRFTVSVGVTSEMLSGNANLGNDVNSGFLVMSSRANLSGKVHLMKVIKKKTSAEMDCSWALNLATLTVQDLKCK